LIARPEERFEACDERVDCVFKVLDIALIILKHIRNYLLDYRRVTLSVDSSEVDQLRQVEEEMFIHHIVIKFKRELLFFGLFGT